MQFLFLCGLAAVASAVPLTTAGEDVATAGLGDMNVVPVQWNVQAFPEGPTLNLTGTIQEVHSKLLDINPNYDADFANRTDAAAVQKRGDWISSFIQCSSQADHYKPFGTLTYRSFNEAIEYFNGLRGKPSMKADACGRVSCSYNGGIYICNSRDYDRVFDDYTWPDIGIATIEIHKTCGDTDNPNVLKGGRMYNYDDWNIVMIHQYC